VADDSPAVAPGWRGSTGPRVSLAVGCALPHAQVTDPAGRLRSTIDLVAGGAFHLLTGPGGEAWTAVCVQIADRTGLDITVTASVTAARSANPTVRGSGSAESATPAPSWSVPDVHIAWHADTAGAQELAALPAAIATLLSRDAAAPAPPTDRLQTIAG